MRVIADRTTPIGFGKHKDLSLKQIADKHPRYFCWLNKDNVLQLKEQKDQKWFKRKSKKLSDDMRAWGNAFCPDWDEVDYYWQEYL